MVSLHSIKESSRGESTDVVEWGRSCATGGVPVLAAHHLQQQVFDWPHLRGPSGENRRPQLVAGTRALDRYILSQPDRNLEKAAFANAVAAGDGAFYGLIVCVQRILYGAP